MYRRTLLTISAATVAGLTGCMQVISKQSEIQTDLLLCSFAASAQSGDIKFVRPEDDAIVLSESFAFPGRTENETSTPSCESHTATVARGDLYRAQVALDSGAKYTYDWRADAQHSLQVEIESSTVRFRKLEKPSP